MDSGEFEIVVDTSGSSRRIAVRGDLDLATVESLRPALDAALEARESASLDLSQCTFLDSSALKAIADACRRAGETGIAFTVARPSPQAARVLQVSGLDKIVHIDAGEYP